MFRSPRLVLAALLASAVLPVLAAPGFAEEEAPPAAKPDGPAEWLAALEKERDEAQLGHVEAYRAFKERFEAFAKEHAGTEAALSAELWLLQQEWWNRKEDTERAGARERAERILKAYPASRQLARMAEYHYVFSAADKASILGRLTAESLPVEVRGVALLTQAGTAKGDARTALLTRLRDDFADVPFKRTTIGALAAAHLAPHTAEDLAVGKRAPEIEGTSSDGTALKLSDHRGKVVLLDFWGDW